MGTHRGPLALGALPERARRVRRAAARPRILHPRARLLPGRTLGVEVAYRPASLPLEADARVGNGTLYGNDTALPTAEARLDLDLGRTREGDHRADRYGLRLGVGGSLGTVFDRAGVALTPAAGFAFDRAPVVSGTRWLAEAHLLAHAGPVQLLVEAAFARESRERDDDGNPATPRVALAAVESGGVSAELAWMVVGAHRTPAAWPGEGGRRWGAVEVAGRYERVYSHAAAADVTPAGTHAGALAVRWWAPRWVTVALAAYAYRYGQAPLEEPGVTASWLALLRVGLSLR
ncbi:MAG: hypothetical protein EPO40_25085 [Myxococcaceae bacterium]|nr:MAG: hypothetical protein EPO40_25085 [Myxococcaceae bacterium]